MVSKRMQLLLPRAFIGSPRPLGSGRSTGPPQLAHRLTRFSQSTLFSFFPPPPFHPYPRLSPSILSNTNPSIKFFLDDTIFSKVRMHPDFDGYERFEKRLGSFQESRQVYFPILHFRVQAVPGSLLRIYGGTVGNSDTSDKLGPLVHTAYIRSRSGGTYGSPPSDLPSNPLNIRFELPRFGTDPARIISK